MRRYADIVGIILILSGGATLLGVLYFHEAKVVCR